MTTISKIVFEMYVNVVFVIRCLYNSVSLTLIKEQHFIGILLLFYLLLLFSLLFFPGTERSSNRKGCWLSGSDDSPARF